MALELVRPEAGPKGPDVTSYDKQSKEPAITRKFLARVATASVIFSGTLGGVLFGVGHYFTTRAEQKADETIQAVISLTDEAKGLRADVKDAKKDLGDDFENVNGQAADLNERACALLEQLNARDEVLADCQELLQQEPPAAPAEKPNG